MAGEEARRWTLRVCEQCDYAAVGGTSRRHHLTGYAIHRLSEVEVVEAPGILSGPVETTSEVVTEANMRAAGEAGLRQAQESPPPDDEAAAARPAEHFTEIERDRLAEALWAYEGDPAVDWLGVVRYKPSEAKRLRAKADVLLSVLWKRYHLSYPSLDYGVEAAEEVLAAADRAAGKERNE